MNDSACATSATNTLQNKIDDIFVALSDLQNLNYIQHLVLSERMQHTSERDVLFTLHYAFRDQLEALQKSCGTLCTNGKTQATPASTHPAEQELAHPQLKNIPLPG